MEGVVAAVKDYEIRIVRQEKILIKAEATKGRTDKQTKGGWKKGKRCKAKKWKPIRMDYDIPF